MRNLPCVSLLRPMSESCPSLLKDGDVHLYPMILGELLAQGVFSDLVLSVSPDTPGRFVDMVSSWGFDVEVGKVSLPHLRLADLARARGWDKVCCISAYSCFFDKAFLARALDAVSGGEFDFTGSEAALSNMEFCIHTPASLDFLRSVKARPLVASKPQAIARSAPDDLRPALFQDACTLSEKLLWLLTYAGDTGTMPADFIRGFYASTPRGQWFDRGAREDHVLRYFKAPAIDWADAVLRGHFQSVIPLEQLAGQLRWIERFDAELPASGDRFVELGFGDIPLISYIMSFRFREVVAFEPNKPFRFDERRVAELLSALGPLLAHRDSNASRGGPSDISVHAAYLEDLRLESASVDCCISKMVFEHVQDVEAVSRELRRILKPGGMMLHEIGLNDHTGGTSSGAHFDFLRYSRQQWTEPWRGTNLMRVNDFVDLWESMGFDVTVSRKVVASNIPTAVHASWFSYRLEDLLCQTAVIKAVKKA